MTAPEPAGTAPNPVGESSANATPCELTLFFNRGDSGSTDHDRATAPRGNP
jgi:hypothetical protein